jgi:aspartate kinase
MEDVVVTGITHDRSGPSSLSYDARPARPAGEVFGSLGDQNIVDMIVQNISRDGLTDISRFRCPADRQRAEHVLAGLARPSGPKACGRRPCRQGFHRRRGDAQSARSPRECSPRCPRKASTSDDLDLEIAVSCVIEDKYTELAVRALHDAFELGRAQ